MQTIWFIRDLDALFLSARRSELVPIARALAALRPDFEKDPVVRHDPKAPDRYPDLLATYVRALVESIDRAGRRLCNAQADLLAGAIERARGTVPPPTTLTALETALLEHVGEADPRDPLIKLALAIARLRRSRINRARRLGFTIEEVTVSAKPPQDGPLSIESVTKWINQMAKSVMGGGAGQPDIGPVVTEAAKEAAKQATDELGCVNVLIAGQTGVGKSTLINAVFGKEVAATGVGRPVTQKTMVYELEGHPLRLYDTAGLEIGEYRRLFDDLERTLRDGATTGTRIHVLWLCINEMSSRLQDGEIELAKLAEQHGIPVIVVLTQALRNNELAQHCRREIATARAVVRVLAAPFNDTAPFGLQDLVQETEQVIPEARRAAFIAAQKVDLAKKRTSARSVLWQYALAGGAAGAVPVPLVAAPAVMAVKVRMAAAICARMGLRVDQTTAKEAAAGMATIMTSSAGVALAVSQALKVVPGLGSIAGGGVGAVTAAASTYVIGHALIEYLYRFNLDHGRVPRQGEIKEGLVRFWQDGKARDITPPDPKPV